MIWQLMNCSISNPILMDSVISLQISCRYIMEDRAGGIWVSSEYTGISRLSVLNEGAERVFPEDETLSDRSNTVRMINRMPDDKIWLGTRRGGLYIYDPHLKTIESSRYFDSNIYAVEEGADGSIWSG